MSSLRFFNTLTGAVDEFEPSAPDGIVGFYACGPTVYDFAHIGNFRSFVFEDLLRRVLEVHGFRVKHVMNLTDVDDKTIAGAARENKPLEEYTARFIEAFNQDLGTLNCLLPHEQPRATRKIPLMLDLIARLIDRGMAYESGGSVYYRVAKFSDYGKLSKKKIEGNLAGASERVDADEYESKEQVSDFVLWKAAKEGEPFWPSPWGNGRPGWHIECSAMSMEGLGPTFDIHAGGEDLIFPHHENEIAQSEGATGLPFVKYWLHCKFLLVDGEKMSKSKGNFYTLRDLLAKGYDPMAIRCALLSTHYRAPLNFTLEGLKDAGEFIRKLDEAFWLCVSRCSNSEGRDDESAKDPLSAELSRIAAEIRAALGQDLNASAALALLLEGVKSINKTLGTDSNAPFSRKDVFQFFDEADAVFGFAVAADKQIPAEVSLLMRERDDVRRQVAADKKNQSLWQKSDELRRGIQAMGWMVKDGKPGEPSVLKRKRRAWDV
ncbi:MAG: cysteine--tRNA ligase [Candidatus Omnitrophica bacterium]|nr:cysteine--tRNA ligase [Candidatus Omnitrophota bacterium]